MTNRYVAVGILLFIMTLPFAGISLGQSNLGKIERICIDAGHGGKDPGAIGTKTCEKHIVLPLALKVGKMIEQSYPDIEVVYTRKKDVFVTLEGRAMIANNHKADLFISIHANSLDTKKNPKGKFVKGVQTYVLGSHKSKENLQVAMRENSVIQYEDDYSIRYEGFDPSSPEAYIMFNLLRSIHLENSLSLASHIQEGIVRSTRQVDREVRQAPFWVLKDVAMPAVLIEVGFISNPDEEKYMMSESGQDKIATGIFNGFKAYKLKVGKKAVNQPVKLTEEKENAVGERETAEEQPKYAIQVASATSRIKNPDGLCPGKKVSELKSAGRYRYYVSVSSSLSDVKKNLPEVRKKVNGCFIIAIYRGNIIPVTEATKLEQKSQ